MKIESHHALINMYFWIKLTVSRFMFGTLPHIILISQLLNFLNNPRNILQTDISNGIPCLFSFFDLTLVLIPREVINHFPDPPK